MTLFKPVQKAFKSLRPALIPLVGIAIGIAVFNTISTWIISLSLLGLSWYIWKRG